MLVAVLLSMMAGAFGVLQAGMNKEIAQTLGFPASLTLNSIFFLLFNLGLFLLVFVYPKPFPQDFAINLNFSAFKWWWAVPGFMGFALVLGLAVSMGRIGAVQTIVVVTVVQVFVSLCWDIMMEGKTIATMRLMGVALATVGAIVAIMN